jgi:hypothetical protein
VDRLEVVVAHAERATVRLGELFLKITLGHPEHLDDVTAGYGDGVDLDRVRAHWALRCLTAIRWLVQHGFDPFAPGCEVDVLRSVTG